MTRSAITRWPREGVVFHIADHLKVRGLYGPEDLERFLQGWVELAGIPAPPFAEEKRALWVKQRMQDLGLSDIDVDAVGNVSGWLPGELPAIVLVAHVDTVFDANLDHQPRRQDGRLAGPGIGDNSLGVAAMLEIGHQLKAFERFRAIYFVGTVGEEGLGDLRGVRNFVDRVGERAGAIIAIEGHFLGRIVNSSVGSRRWRIGFRGSGGHSWHDYGKPSAVHGIGKLIQCLASLKLPDEPRTTLNVGRVEGGEGINVLARRASLEVDLRSTDQATLVAMSKEIERIARQSAQSEGLSVDLTTVGHRPAASIAADHPLVQAALEALSAVGESSVLTAASTDANYPASKGIPSICIGIGRGGGMHTQEEWIEEASVATGLRQLLLLTTALAETRP